MSALSQFNAYITTQYKAAPQESNGQPQSKAQQGAQSTPAEQESAAVPDGVNVDEQQNLVIQTTTMSAEEYRPKRGDSKRGKRAPKSKREENLRMAARDLSRKIDDARSVLRDHNLQNGRPRDAIPAPVDTVGQRLLRQIEDLERQRDELNRRIVEEQRRNQPNPGEWDQPHMEGGESPTDTKDGTAGNKAPGDGGKGQGEGGKPGEQEAGVTKSAQDLANKVDAYDAAVKKIQQRREDLEKRLKDLEAKKNQGKGNQTDSKKEEEQLSKESDALEKASEAKVSEGQALTKELNSLPEGTSKTKLLEGAANKLLDAIGIVESIAYILQAGSATEVLKRTAEVEVNLAEGALILAVTKSNLVTLIVSTLIQLPDDQGAGVHQRQAEAMRKAEEEQRILQFTAEYLQKVHPGAVEWNGNAPVIHDQKLWDATLARVRKVVAQKKQEAYAASMEKWKYHVHMLGLEDGMAGERTHEDEALFNEHGGDAAFKEMQKVIEAAYDTGFTEGEIKIKPLLQRAHDWGAEDRMAGNRKARREEAAGWSESASARLVEAYDEGYDSVAAGVGSESG